MRARCGGRLNFRGQPTKVNTEGPDLLGGTVLGCAGVIGVVITALGGLFVLIWLIKRMRGLA